MYTIIECHTQRCFSISLAFEGRKWALDISHCAPLSQRQQQLRLLAQTWKELRYYPLIWTESRRSQITLMTGFLPHNEGTQRPQMTKLSYLSVLQTNQTQKTTTINMQRRTTSLWCCASLHGVRGEKEPLMHLISAPLESSSSYRCPCPSGRDIQSRKCSGGAD